MMHDGRVGRRVLAGALGLAGWWAGQVAWSAEPDWKANLTRLPAGEFPVLDPCELVYHLSWSNILKAGETSIRFYSRGQDGRTPEEIYTYAEMRSAGLARALWPYDGKNESWVERDSLVPVRVLQEEEDRQERNVYRTEFLAETVVNAWTSERKKGGGAAELKNRTYPQTDPPMQDMVGAMLYLRSLPLRGLEKPVSLVCYPFRDPYLVTITPRGREEHEMLGREVPALKFEVALAKVEQDQSLKSYDEKMKSAHFWISDDDQRIPLELRADIFIGSILVSLKEYRNLGQAAAAGGPGAVLADEGGDPEREAAGEPERRRIPRKRSRGLGPSER